MMPKWLLFGIAAVGDSVVAALVAYYGGRVVIPRSSSSRGY